MGLRTQVICSPAVGAGFRLAGFAPVEVESPEEGTARLRAALDQPGLGIVLTEERLYQSLAEDVRRSLARRPLPTVVPFPDPGWVVREESPEAFVAELLRQAIGYRVRLG